MQTDQPTFSPFECAVHAPDRFRELFAADADEYLHRLGFDPETVRREAVRIVVRGQKQYHRFQRIRDREQRIEREHLERERQALVSRFRMARLRVKRLRKLCRRLIAEKNSPRQIRLDFVKALKRRRSDCKHAPPVASRRELQESIEAASCREFCESTEVAAQAVGV